MADKTEILAIITEVLQQHGDIKGFENVSYDGDNDSGSMCFNFCGEEFIITDQGIRDNEG